MKHTGEDILQANGREEEELCGTVAKENNTVFLLLILLSFAKKHIRGVAVFILSSSRPGHLLGKPL